MVKLAVFPKCFMDALCVDHSMTIFEWIEMASTLGVDGLEFYSGFVDSLDESTLEKVKQALRAKKLEMPMLCYSPNFTIADAAQRREEIAKQNAMVDISQLRWEVLPGFVRTGLSGHLEAAGRLMGCRFHSNVPRACCKAWHRLDHGESLQRQLLALS